MEILINNQIKNISDDCCVQQLLDELIPDKQKGIALAVNSSIVPKTNWKTYLLKEKDDVLIIRATQGG